MGALSITGQPKYRKDFEPLLAGPRWIPANDSSALEAAVNDNTAAIVLEGIQGEGGIYPMRADFLRQARQLADAYNALLVFDATQCGGKENCRDEGKCITHDLWANLNQHIIDYLKAVSLKQLVDEQRAKQQGVAQVHDMRDNPKRERTPEAA